MNPTNNLQEYEHFCTHAGGCGSEQHFWKISTFIVKI